MTWSSRFRLPLCLHVDSVGKPLETNLYAYTGNNPINRIDSFGHTWLEYIPTSGTLYIHPGDANKQAPPQRRSGVSYNQYVRHEVA